ncbi:MAG: SIS domain-containing protein, partial [Alphaproteobacteria bacterium]
MTAAPIETAAAKATSADLEAARRVLSTEGEALAELARSLDHRFSRAVDLIMAVEGRVIVSGMGKSGLVGTKIAATFASTGTPSQFVHPGEASQINLDDVTPDNTMQELSRLH